MQATRPRIVGPNDGKAGFLGSIGVRFMIDGGEADNRFSLVEHPMSAGALAAPMRTLGDLCARYGLELDPSSVPRAAERALSQAQRFSRAPSWWVRLSDLAKLWARRAASRSGALQSLLWVQTLPCRTGRGHGS